MPLSDGTLTALEFEMVNEKLALFWGKVGGRPPCRACGSNRYYIHPALLGNRSDTLTPTEYHTRFPAVGVYCADCGHMEQHVAWVLGLLPLQVPPPPPAVSPALAKPFDPNV